MKRIKRCIALSLCLITSLAYSIPPPPLSFKDDAVFNYDFSVFPISSEMQIGKLQPIILRAPKGGYVTVGAERSFRAVSMMPQATFLLQFDVAGDIVRFNLINTELLKTPSREHYQKLRWQASFLDWKAFIAERFEKGIKVKLSKDDFEWWQKKVRDLDAMNYKLPEYLNRYHKSPPCDAKDKYEKSIDLATVLDYKTGNYLFYDDLYANLHRLAIEERILTLQINLMDKSQIDQLVGYLKENNLQIGLLDLDNLYYKDYLGQEAFHTLLHALKPLGVDDSILVVMSNYKDYACGQYQIYMGFRFNQVDTWPKALRMQTFIDSLKEPVWDLIDGKLFETKDKLPNYR